MGFWDEYAEAERALLPPSSQDAAAKCDECGQTNPNVFFGSCLACFNIWEAGHAG